MKIPGWCGTIRAGGGWSSSAASWAAAPWPPWATSAPKLWAAPSWWEEVATGSPKYIRVTRGGAPRSHGHPPGAWLQQAGAGGRRSASLHDALCVVRCLVKRRALIAGGGAPEMEISLRLAERARLLSGLDAYCVGAFAEALEVVPYTLAENAGLHPIATVTELRNRHAKGERDAGINVRKGSVTNILEENVVQPLLVSTSAVTLAAETVRSILKIDDIVQTVR
uniref:T-complex protein 1 subunit delta n=1 Tax=Ixodes scapularis TaxID=6945 RepID=A0A4D5RVT9_IXOSC